MNLQTVDDLIEELQRLTPAERKRLVRLGAQHNERTIVIDHFNGVVILQPSAIGS